MILRLRPVFLKAPLLAALLGAGLQLASPPAQAALFGDDEARQAVLNLRTKVDTLQRDLSRQLNDLASRQTDIEQRLGRLEVSQKASLSRQNDIDSLRQEVAQLRGQLEDTLNQLQQAQKSQQDMSADMDSRLKRFEPTQVTIDGRQFSVEQAEKNEFEAALALFRKSNFKAADQAFTKFAKTYPESPYLPTALYWQGGVEQDILRLTRTIPMAGTELAKITASGGQLGVARKDLPKFTETIAKMSVAFDMAADQAGDSMAKLANVYQIPIDQIGKLGDAVNHLSNSSPAKAGDIINTLGRVGGVAKQFGLTEIQTTSLSNAFISLGKTPEIAGTAINGMLTKLMTADKQGAKFQQALKNMGMESKDLKKAIKENGEQALMDFLKQVGKLPKENQMGALVDLFGLEYADDVAVLVGGLETYKKSIEELKKTSKDGKPAFIGSMDKEFAARSATTANNWQIFKNSLTEIGITAGSVLLPALNQLMTTIRPIINSFADWASKNPEVVSALVHLAAGFAALKVGGLMFRFVATQIGRASCRERV